MVGGVAMMDMIFKSTKRASEKPENLDLEFYKKSYKDLSSMNDEQLVKHWRLHGEKEGRCSSLIGITEKLGVEFDFFKEFDPEFYIDLYPDVAEVCLGSFYPAYEHYYLHGHSEKRCCSFQEFLIEQDLSGLFDSGAVEPKKVFRINRDSGISINYKKFIDMLGMEGAIKLQLTHDSSVDADFYKDLGKHYELNGQLEKAKNSYLISIMLAENSEVM